MVRCVRFEVRECGLVSGEVWTILGVGEEVKGEGMVWEREMQVCGLHGSPPRHRGVVRHECGSEHFEVRV